MIPSRKVMAAEDPATRTDTILRARVHAGVVVVAVVSGILSLVGSFASGPSEIIAYVLALTVVALVILLVAKEHLVQGRAWLLIGSGVALWALGGFLLALREDAGVLAISSLMVSLCYALGYLPLLLGLAELCDPQLRVRRVTTAIDSVLLFLALYAVLWLTVVEQVSGDGSLSKVERAFSALYPAGDLVAVMLAVRLVCSRVIRRRVGLLLLAAALLTTAADVALLALYLENPYGQYPITDFVYLVGLSVFAVAAVWSLLPAPPPVAAGAASSRRLAYLVAISSVIPPLVLVLIELYTDREVAVGPVAVWVLVAVGAAVARQMAGVREQVSAHQKSLWLASHEPTTDMLHRTSFLREVSNGRARDRSGTVLVVEVTGLHELRDAYGHDAVEFTMAAVALRLRAEVGDNAVFARLAHDQLACFLHSTGSARGREAAVALQRRLASGFQWDGVQLALPAIVGVAQADGAVIDGPAAVRRAVEAVRHGRLHGAGYVAVDADLIGSAAVQPVAERSLVRP